MVTAITNGKDSNFFQKLTVTSTTFLTNSDITLNIRGQQCISIINEGSVKVEYSFNGNILHGDLTPSSASSGFIWDNRVVSAIWFRVPNGGNAVVRVEAWARV